MPGQEPLGNRISSIIMSGHANDHFWPILSQSQSHRPTKDNANFRPDSIPWHGPATVSVSVFSFRFSAFRWPVGRCPFCVPTIRLPILATGHWHWNWPGQLPAAGQPNEAIICGPAEHNCCPSSASTPPGGLLVGVTYINGKRCTRKNKELFLRVRKPVGKTL